MQRAIAVVWIIIFVALGAFFKGMDGPISFFQWFFFLMAGASVMYSFSKRQ